MIDGPISFIRLAALDIDGCLTRGETFPADLHVLEALQEWNRKAADDPAVPDLTLISGRPAPYVESMLQMIGGKKCAVFENGAGMYDPETYEFRVSPHAPDNLGERFREITRLFEERFVRTGRAKIQPGKFLSWSLYPHPGFTVAGILKEAEEVCAGAAPDALAETSVYCVNVGFAALNKGSGLEWLAGELGVSLSETAAVGDSAGDVAMLARAGFGAAPANAAPATKAAARWTASREFGDGVLEIIERIIESNRRAAGG